MTISNAAISSIQKTGAAAYAASEKLKKEADNYAKRVREALNDNPFDLNNDALIENWKNVAKLVQTLTGMENELKNIHRIASNLATEESEIQPTHQVLSLLAPTATTATATTTATTASKNQDAVDVTPKKSKPAAKKKPAAKPVKATKPMKPVKPAKAAKAAAVPVTAKVVPVKATKPVKTLKPVKAKRKSPAKPTAPVDITASNMALDATGVTTVPVDQTVTTIRVSNADKLLDYLATTLNAESFIAINLKTTTEATGIPMGSINAAIKKVIELGKVTTDDNGGYRLTA